MASSSKSDPITLLWQFKRACDASSDKSLPFIHFSALLGNESYRTQTLTAATESTDARVAELAAQVLEQAPAGSLLRQIDTAGESLEFDQTTEFKASLVRAKRSSQWRWVSLLTGAVAIIVLSVLVLMRLDSGSTVVRVADNISGDVKWSSGKRVVLESVVFVTPGTTLTIEPGVTILGKPGAALLVARGANLHARGRPDAPIVFTSHQPVGQRQAGDWGGVVLMGAAPTNTGVHRIEGVPEGETLGEYGGQDAESSCGVLEYARIEFAGFEISLNNELNGLTLAGCGRGTIVRHVQVHRTLDDGIEMFGGTANLRNLLVTQPGDDGFDWDHGWTGNVQSLIVQMGKNTGDNGFEGDNNGDVPDALPRSAPTFSNVTLIADPMAQRTQRAMVLREGTAGTFRNFVIAGFGDDLIDVRGPVSQGLAAAGELSVTHSLFVGDRPPRAMTVSASDDSGDPNAWLRNPETENLFVLDQALLRTATDARTPRFTPDVGPALQSPGTIPRGEFWNEGARYRGALPPGSNDNWLSKWTAFPPA